MLAGEKEGLCWLRKAHHNHRVLNPLKSPSSRGSAARERASHACHNSTALAAAKAELGWAGCRSGEGWGGWTGTRSCAAQELPW